MSVVPLLRQKMHLRRLRQKASDQRGTALARVGWPTTATPPLSAGHPLTRHMHPTQARVRHASDLVMGPEAGSGDRTSFRMT